LQKLVPGLDDPAGLTHGILGEIRRGIPTLPEVREFLKQRGYTMAW